MLTRTMPSVMRALGSALDSQTLKSFTQALGNCNQPLEHRGNVEMSPTNYFIRQGEYGGDTYNQGYSTNQYTQYNPTFQNIYAPNFGDFNPIFPPPFFPDPILPPNLDPGDQFIDIGGDINNNINNNLYPSTFFFPTTNNFNYTTQPHRWQHHHRQLHNRKLLHHQQQHHQPVRPEYQRKPGAGAVRTSGAAGSRRPGRARRGARCAGGNHPVPIPCNNPAVCAAGAASRDGPN